MSEHVPEGLPTVDSVAFGDRATTARLSDPLEPAGNEKPRSIKEKKADLLREFKLHARDNARHGSTSILLNEDDFAVNDEDPSQNEDILCTVSLYSREPTDRPPSDTFARTYYTDVPNRIRGSHSPHGEVNYAVAELRIKNDKEYSVEQTINPGDAISDISTDEGGGGLDVEKDQITLRSSIPLPDRTITEEDGQAPYGKWDGFQADYDRASGQFKTIALDPWSSGELRLGPNFVEELSQSCPRLPDGTFVYEGMGNRKFEIKDEPDHVRVLATKANSGAFMIIPKMIDLKDVEDKLFPDAEPTSKAERIEMGKTRAKGEDNVVYERRSLFRNPAISRREFPIDPATGKPKDLDSWRGTSIMKLVGAVIRPEKPQPTATIPRPRSRY